MGQIQGNDLSSAFASADVFCMPSDSETLGFVVLESMACGVPVVGANAGGIPKPVPKADVATVRTVKPINPKKTPNKSFVETGWQNAGRSS